MGVDVPQGWPRAVRPPGAPDWEASAVTWLLDWCPADYRAYPLLRRHPIVLARLAAQFVEGQISSSRRALSQARSSLEDVCSERVLDATTTVLEKERARLEQARRSVVLVEGALRGAAFHRIE